LMGGRGLTGFGILMFCNAMSRFFCCSLVIFNQ